MESKSKKVKASAESATSNAGNEKFYIPNQELEDLNERLESIFEDYMTFAPETALSDAERRRLLGSGVRRYGFIDKTSDVASSNLEFAPPYLDLTALKKYLRDIENLRNISVTLKQLSRLNSDLFLIISDEAFRLALMYYNSVRDASRRRVPGAEAVFETLRLFFQRSSRATDEPTEMELKHDVNALLQGKKDGKIIIENETPQKTRGKHVVIDDTYKTKTNFRETESGEVRES
jgi:hypothetical protein